MAIASLLAPFESLVNRNISASTPARQILKELSGRAFAIEVGTPLGGRLFRLRLAANESGVAVGSGEEPADATISGTPLAMLSLLGDRGLGQLRAQGIKVGGDAEIAQAFEKLLGYARPDLEEELARIAGDTPAHYLAGAARGAFAWARRARDSLARDVGEYLNEEGRDLVPAAELEVFLGEVDRIRDDTERAESRIALLERSLAAGSRR
jgi:ubiquinone biosynthesis protein UbiJ